MPRKTELMIKIGIRIKSLRIEANLTQKELADKLGLKNDTAVANYESGYSIPKDEIKISMSNLFNCSIDYIMCKTDNRSNVEINENLINIGLNKNDYTPPTKEQQEKIKEYAELILRDNLKRKED